MTIIYFLLCSCVGNGNERIALIAGNETYGITKETLGMCDEDVFIPMLGKGASLNVSVATAIALHQFNSNACHPEVLEG